MAASGLGMAGCASSRKRTAAPVAAPDLPYGPCLPPVHVDPAREIKTITGLRPYRPSGFVVRAEKIGDKLVVHNYGHGGGGVTLSWGTAKLAVDLAAQGHTGPVAVLGCGAVGMATARLLQQAGLRVAIYAKDLPPYTTSNIAAAQWFPVSVSDPQKRTPEFNRQFLAASQFAYQRYQSMVGSRYGVRWMRNYMLTQQPFREDGYYSLASPLKHLMPQLRDVAPSEHPFTGFPYVRQFDSMMIETPIYIRALLDEVRQAGARIERRTLGSLSELQALREGVIINCTGLGAKALFGDEELTPIKGQLTILQPQPEVRYATIAGDLYMFSRRDGVLLGGTHAMGDWSLEPDLEKKSEIVTGHKKFFESFRACSTPAGS